jgi:hypothetical protein
MAVTKSGKDKVQRHMRLYVGGIDLSGDSRTFGTADNTFEFVDLTGWDQTVRNGLADGMPQVGLRGYVAHLNDTATTGSHTVLSDSDNADRLSLLFGGGGAPAIGDPAYLLPSVQISDTASIDSGASILTADFLVDSRQYIAASRPWGVTLHPDTSLSSTTSASSVDNEGSSSAGARANLHVTVSSGGTWAFTIEHSTDDSAWATLMTFTADGSAVTSEQQSSTGTVNQYLRLLATRTSGSVTPIVTIARG